MDTAENSNEQKNSEIDLATYYADNFRGFSNQTFELQLVNFLVGENSSGKSSLIYLMSLFSTTSFWMQSDFEVEDFNISRFDDVCSRHNGDETFRIGRVSKDSVVFAEYKNKRGYPRLNAVLFSSGNRSFFGIEDAGNNWLFYYEENTAKSIDDFYRIKKTVLDSEKSIVAIPGPDNLFALIMLMMNRKVNSSKDLIQQEVQTLFLSLWEGISNTISIAPIRARPKRLYEGDNKKRTTEGDHIPFILKKIFTQAKPKTTKLEKFGSESGLFDGISLKRYGTDDDAPFSLNVVFGEKEFSLLHVGYGVSQVLPIIMDLDRTAKGKMMLVQQPEVHLHPKAQAQLGDYFYRNRNDSILVIETHSDFLIDRFRQKCRDEGAVKSQVIFFSRKENINRICNLVIGESGQYPEQQPSEFREFFYNESLNNFGI